LNMAIFNHSYTAEFAALSAEYADKLESPNVTPDDIASGVFLLLEAGYTYDPRSGVWSAPTLN
jgi:hypothetical protein